MGTKNLLEIASICLLFGGCISTNTDHNIQDWNISMLPSSVLLDPASNEIIEHRFDAIGSNQPDQKNLLEKNWIYDGEQVSLHAARGEYISFQLVLTNHTDSALKGINIQMSPFKDGGSEFNIRPELFLEWAVEVKTLSTGYPKASLGKGWYPNVAEECFSKPWLSQFTFKAFLPCWAAQ